MGIKFRSDEARIPRTLRTRNFSVPQVLLRTCLEGEGHHLLLVLGL